MLNNSINTNTNLQNLQKERERQVFNAFLQNSNSKTALAPKGRLVHENPFQKAASAVKDTGKDVVNLGKALKNGESDDHSLGRLNDLGMKLGGLGIATYLFTRKTTPKNKLMEFIGGGMFFASMALWPKLFIAAPIKARFGFDVQQKYVDSQGRKKELFLDNGYIPKLESKEELTKLADDLNVPKDLEFREEYALEKRRRIALQARTLWMLTAGFATPLMTALACNKIEEHIDKPLIESGVKKAQKTAQNFASVVDGRVSNPLFDKESANIIKSFQNYSGNVDDDFFAKVASAFDPSNNVEGAKFTAQMPDLTPSLKEDVRSLFAAQVDEKQMSDELLKLFIGEQPAGTKTVKMSVFDPNLATTDGRKVTTDIDVEVETLRKAISDTVKKVKTGEVEYSPEGIIDSLKGCDALNRVKESSTNIYEGPVGVVRFKRGREIRDIIEKSSPGLDRAELAKIVNKMVEVDPEYLKRVEELKSDSVQKGIDTMGSKRTMLYTIPAEIMRDENGKFTSFVDSSKKSVMPKFVERLQENYKGMRTLNASVVSMEDTVRAMDNSFGKEYFNVVDSIFKVVKPTNEELELMRSSADAATDVIQARFQEIVKDPNKYEALVKNISAAPVMTDAERQGLIDTVVQNARGKLDEASRSFDPQMKTLRDFSNITTSTSSGLVGDFGRYVKGATLGIDSTKDRLLLTLDFEKRLQDGTLLKQWNDTNAVQFVTEKVKQSDGSIKDITKEVPLDVRQSFEEFVADARQILYKNTMNDFSNTHYLKGNGAYFQKLNNVLFNQPMSKETSNAAGEGLTGALNAMRTRLMAVGSNGKSVSKIYNTSHAADYVSVMNFVPEGIIKDENLRKLFVGTIAEPDAIKYQMTGKSIKNLIFENAGQKFNTKTWKKMFVPMALALVGVTLLAQLFIGRDKDQHLYKKKNVNTGAVNGNQQ